MPYTGADKGIFFVPEIGEEVVVGFENGNAEKPYVMGSLYHGKARPDSFKSDKNHIKAIRTDSGHTVKFTDTPGKEEIRISDVNGNYIAWSTHASSITISTPGDLTINAPEHERKGQRKL